MGRDRKPPSKTGVSLRPVGIAAVVAVVAAALVLATQSPALAATVSSISTGDHHSCALFADGSVKCWGRGDSGQLGYEATTDLGDDGAEMGNNLGAIALGSGRTATAIATGGDHTCALLDNGSVN